MKPHGLERCFVPLLFLIEHSGKTTQTELGQAIRRDKVSVMRMVDYLSERDFVKRKQGEEDRRCQLLEVTQKALDIEPFIRKGITQTNELLMNDFTPEEKEIFKRGMDKLYQNITHLPEPEFIINASKKDGKEKI